MTLYKGTLYTISLIALINGVFWAIPSDRLLDFGSFWASGEAAHFGLNPYDVYKNTFIIHTPTFNLINFNLNPPASLLVFTPLSFLEPNVGFNLVLISSLMAYCVLIIYLHNRYQKNSGYWLAVWAFSLPAFWDTLHLGQIYVWLAVCSVAGWVFIEQQRNLVAAIFIGILIAFKPNFLVWPSLLFISGHYRLAINIILIAGGLQLISGAIFGWHIFEQWWQVIANDAGRQSFPTNLAILGLVSKFNLPGIFLSSPLVFLMILACITWYRKPSLNDVGKIGLLASILASPIGWIHYILMILPIFFTLKKNKLTEISMCLFLIPATSIIGFNEADLLTKVTIGSAYSWGAIAILFIIIMDIFDLPKIDNTIDSSHHAIEKNS